LRKKLSQIKHVIISYYIVVSVIFALYVYFSPIDRSMDEMITIILSAFLILFPVVMLYTLRYALHIFLFVLALLSGFYGFYHHSIDDHSVSNALYFTFRLYLLDLADVFTSDGSSPVTYPFLLEIARWSAASYTISTIFIAMYRTMEKKIELFFAQIFGGHHLVFGYNERSHFLIEDLRKNGERVIVVDEKFSPDTQNMLEQMKIIVIQAPIDDERVFHLCAAKKASSITLFHKEDQDSLSLLMNLQKFSQTENIELRFSRLLIHIEDNRFKLALKTFLEEVEHFSGQVMMMNVYEEVAKKFWRNHSHIFDNDAHLLIVGFNQLGEQISAIAQEEHSQIQPTSHLAITVLDNSVSNKAVNPIEFVAFDLPNDSLKEIILQRNEIFTHIFICLDQDYLDLMEGIELSESFADTPIYMYFTDDSIEQMLMIAHANSSLQSTGMIKDVLTKEYLHL